MIIQGSLRLRIFSKNEIASSVTGDYSGNKEFAPQKELWKSFHLSEKITELFEKGKSSKKAYSAFAGTPLGLNEVDPNLQTLKTLGRGKI